MILKHFEIKSALAVKIVSVILAAVMLMGIVPNGQTLGIFSLSALAEGLPSYDPTLGEFIEENGLLTAIPNENCGFRGWYSNAGEEVSINKSFTIPNGKTADDYFPVFYNLNLVENGGFEASAPNTDLYGENWGGTSNENSVTVSGEQAQSGQKSAKISLNNSSVYRTINDLEKNTQYVLSFYYKSEKNLNFVSVVQAETEITSSANSNGEKYLAKKTNSELLRDFSSQNWNKLSLTFFTEENTSVNLCLYSEESPIIYVDDISVVKNVLAAPEYFNDDFEKTASNDTASQKWKTSVDGVKPTLINSKTVNTLKMFCNDQVSYVTSLSVKSNNKYRIEFEYYAENFGTIDNEPTVITSVGVAPKLNGNLIFRNHTISNPKAIMTVYSAYSWTGSYFNSFIVNNTNVKASVNGINSENWYKLSFEFNSGSNNELQFYINPVTIGSGAEAYLEITNFRVTDLSTNLVEDKEFLDSSRWNALNSRNETVNGALPTESSIITNKSLLKVASSNVTGIISSPAVLLKKGSKYTFKANVDISEFKYSYVPKTDASGNILCDTAGNVIYQKNGNTNDDLVNWINFSFSNQYGVFGSAADGNLVVSNGAANAVGFTVSDSAGNIIYSTNRTYSAAGFGIAQLKYNTSYSNLTVAMTFVAENTGIGYLNIRNNGLCTYYLDSISLEEDNQGTDIKSVVENSALKTVGTAIRTEGKQGIRHKTSLDKALLTADNSYGLRFTEYGTLAIKTEYLGENELVLDGKYALNGNEYTAKKGVAYSFENKIDKVFYDNNNYLEFTGVLINIAKENWNNDYTVRAYFKYLDKNGNEDVIYIDPSDVAVYPVAKEAYSAKNANGEYVETERVRNYLYKNVLTLFSDKQITIKNNSTPIYKNFQGISSTVYHATAFFPDSHGRTYTDEQAALEMDRLVDSKVNNVRTRFDSHWMWTTSGWNWDSVKMQAVYKWANMLADRDISITLNLGWSIRDFIFYYDYNKNGNANKYSTNGHSSITEVDYLHGVGEDIYGEDAKISAIKNYPNINLTDKEKAHYSVVAARYAEWGRQALNAFKARGINNIEYIIPFTETGYSMEASGDNTFSYDEWMMFTMALHDALKQDEIRVNYKFIGPCQSIQAQQNRKVPFIEYIYSNIKGTDYENMLDINAMHQYTIPNTKAGYENTVYDPVASYLTAEQNFPYYQQILNNVGVTDMEFWCDEYFAYANDARWWDNVGMQMTQFAAGLTTGMNNGVNRFLTWQMFDSLWDANATHGTAHTLEDKLTNEFIGGVHAVGTCPSLIKANGETCTIANCPCKNYTSFSSYTPRVTYYGINLLGKYLNNENAKVLVTKVVNNDTNFDGGVYVSAIKNDNGKIVVLVVNTMPTVSSVDVCLENMPNTIFTRYVYNPEEIIPTAEAIAIPSDGTVISDKNSTFYQIIPSGSFAIYVQSGTYEGDDFEIDMGEDLE